MQLDPKILQEYDLTELTEAQVNLWLAKALAHRSAVSMQLAAVDIELFGKSLTQFPDEHAVTNNKRLRTIRKLKRVL
jgi:hypothetical protein